MRLDRGRLAEVLGDPGRLRQVLDNLLANVRAHTPTGTTTTLWVRAQDGDAVITIADDGPGLTDEQAARVFERFTVPRLRGPACTAAGPASGWRSSPPSSPPPRGTCRHGVAGLRDGGPIRLAPTEPGP